MVYKAIKLGNWNLSTQSNFKTPIHGSQATLSILISSKKNKEFNIFLKKNKNKKSSKSDEYLFMMHGKRSNYLCTP